MLSQGSRNGLIVLCSCTLKWIRSHRDMSLAIFHTTAPTPITPLSRRCNHSSRSRPHGASPPRRRSCRQPRKSSSRALHPPEMRWSAPHRGPDAWSGHCGCGACNMRPCSVDARWLAYRGAPDVETSLAPQRRKKSEICWRGVLNDG